jgi:hypothetical protein
VNTKRKRRNTLIDTRVSPSAEWSRLAQKARASIKGEDDHPTGNTPAVHPPELVTQATRSSKAHRAGILTCNATSYNPKLLIQLTTSGAFSGNTCMRVDERATCARMAEIEKKTSLLNFTGAKSRKTALQEAEPSPCVRMLVLSMRVCATGNRCFIEVAAR